MPETIQQNAVSPKKVVSILEPWASLIKEKVKYIETRSWSTKYRGELYIHASRKTVSAQIATEHKIAKQAKTNYDVLLNLLHDTDFNYGCIIAKCKLVDCIYMTEEFIEKVKKNHNEYVSGVYNVGRYAWILEDIEVITPIPAKGQLGIWEYTPAQITQKAA